MKKEALLLVLLLVIPLASALIFPKEVLFFDKLSTNMQTKLVDNQEILFTKLGIATKEDVTRAKITVQAMPDCPENAPYQTDVLQCFAVTALNMGEKELLDAEISFKVPKGWVNANNYDKNAIQLRRYSYAWNNNSSQWKILQTILEGEDEKDYHYSATADGFSYFSIVGGKKTEEQKSNDAAINNQVSANQEQSEEIQESPKQEKNIEDTQETPIQESPKFIALKSSQPKNNFSYWWIFIATLVLSSIVLLPVLPRISNNKPLSPFEQLTTYIHTQKNTPEDEIKKKLLGVGWQEWQINIAFDAIKKRK